MALMQHLTIVRQGAEDIRAFRHVHPEIQFDLQEADLRNADLQNADLQNADLRNADLRNANLRGANLTGAALIQADLTDSNLKNAVMNSANLGDASLRRADLTGANLSNANLQNTNLRDALPFNFGADVFDVIRTPVRPEDFPKLFEANLDGLDLSNCSLPGIDLQGAKLIGASLTGTDLCRANFTNAILTKTNLARAHLFEANLQLADLRGADLSGAQLVRTDLSRADISGAKLLGAQIDSTTNLSSIQCYNSTVDRSTAEYMRAFGATLGQMMDLTIVDDLATLRSEFGGIWGAIHVTAVFVFLLPYVWFVSEQVVTSKSRTNSDSRIVRVEDWVQTEASRVDLISTDQFQKAVRSKIHLNALQWREKFGLRNSTEIPIWRALARYIWNGGLQWREGFVFNGWPFCTFVVVAIYNGVRLALLIKTKQLETLESVRSLPVKFSLGNGLKSWRTVYRLNRIGYWLAIVLILKNTVYFLSSPIQV